MLPKIPSADPKSVCVRGQCRFLFIIGEEAGRICRVQAIFAGLGETQGGEFRVNRALALGSVKAHAAALPAQMRVAHGKGVVI